MKTQSYNNFWQSIHQAAKTKAFPLRVMFELTYRCNFKCRHCYVPVSYRKAGELKTKEVFSILEQLKELGCFYLGFTGGEPLVRNDIIDILWYAKKKGFEVIIYSNGSLIDKSMACVLADLRPNKVDITLPAMSKSAFERISGLVGSRDKVFKAIDFLYKKGVNLGFKTCVLKENSGQIKEIQDFAHSLGALHRLDDMLSRRLDGSKEPFRYRGQRSEVRGQKSDVRGQRSEVRGQRSEVRSQRSEVRGQRSEVRSQRSEVRCQKTEDRRQRTEDRGQRVDCDSGVDNRRRQFADLFKCGTGLSQVAVTPFGELKMCLMIDYPKYKILTEDRGQNRLSVIGYRLSEKIRTEHRTPNTAHRTAKVNLKEAWEKLKELVKNIKPDKNYRCNTCKLQPYCKWCPAKGWLYNGDFTSCDPESRASAGLRKTSYENRG